VIRKARPLGKSWRTAAPGWNSQARAFELMEGFLERFPHGILASIIGY
jgi:hypothetical protein